MRVGPAKARPKRVKQILYDGSESEDDHVIPSEFETNDEELAVYLQTNTSFLLEYECYWRIYCSLAVEFLF